MSDNKQKPNYTFVMRCEMERFGTMKLGYTLKDLEILKNNIAPNGWGNTRVKFHKENNKPFMVLIPPVNKENEQDREPVPEEKQPWQEPDIAPPEESEKKKMPF